MCLHGSLPLLGEVIESGEARLAARAQEVVGWLGKLTGEDLVA